MTVSDPNVIDIVGVDRQTGEVVLTLCDHLDWNDSEGHLTMLQEKLNRYLTIVESGELAESFPAKDRQVRIDVAFMHPPSNAAKDFLWQAERIIATAGCRLTWRISMNREDASVAE